MLEYKVVSSNTACQGAMVALRLRLGGGSDTPWSSTATTVTNASQHNKRQGSRLKGQMEQNALDI